MKKATLLAMAAALFMSATAVAQQTQEVTYVEDPTQGYLFNRFQDNWFITAEGGAGVNFTKYDQHRNFSDRFAPAAGLYVGKWFSPIVGLRLGVSWMQTKGMSDGVYGGTRPDEHMTDGLYKQKFNHFGPMGDVMVNLTNWWCGYKPGRVYNAIVYAGAGGYFTMARKIENGKSGEWANMHDNVMAVRAGLINQFRVSDQVALSLDIRWTGIENHADQSGTAWNKVGHDVEAFLGVTYLFKKREWNAPIVPVCPPAENCDALRARLEAAEGRIADLEAQLRDCLNKPSQVVEENNAPLATIYYPINVYRLTKKDIGVLGAVSEVMKSNPNTKYVLTGWADNYTGTEEFNIRLRHNRVNGVEKQLVKMGVPQSQLTATINNGNLCDLGEKYVALDRAVTIDEAK